MVPLTISFRGMPRSEAIASLIEHQASELERLFPRLQRCRVVVERLHARRHTEVPVHLRLQLHVPGSEIVIEDRPTLHAELASGEGASPSKSSDITAPYVDPALAVREAFRAAKRRLHEENDRLQREVKRH